MVTKIRISYVTNDLAMKGLTPHIGSPRYAATGSTAWKKVANTGSALWLDTGDIDAAKRNWHTEFAALTTNNSLLKKEVTKGIYDSLIRESAAKLRHAEPGIGHRHLMQELAFILNARHALKLIDLFDAHVSVELHTDFGDDADRSVEYAQRYFAVCPERFYIKIPLTPAGLVAAARLHRLDVPVNLTLGFSARQNYLAARFAQPEFVNVFLGRLNSFVADNQLGSGLYVGEKATLATQRRILKLRESGKTRSHLIAASLRQADQIASLAGVDVLTMPPKVAEGYKAAPAYNLESQVQNDPAVELAPGIDPDDVNLSSLWEIPPAFESAVDEIMELDPRTLDPSDMRIHFETAGFGDLFPRWTADDFQTIAADGKIPVYEKWKTALAEKQIGLDALMNTSAFYAFDTDQKTLDRHIQKLIRPDQYQP